MRSYGRVGWMTCMVVVCACALVMGRNAHLQAQSSNKSYATVEEVTKAFMRGITGEEMYGDCGSDVKDFDWRSAGVFSARDQEEFPSGEIQNMVERMRGAWRHGALNSTSWEVEEIATESGTKTVRLKQGMPVTPEIVSLWEDDSWRVSLRKTYAKWFDLKNDAELSTHLQKLKLSSCQSNLKQIALATFQYVQDYDEKFPPAKDWQNLLWPYVKNRAIFHCPLLPDDPEGIGYAYNWKFSQKEFAKVDFPATMIAYYETSEREPSHSGGGDDVEYRHEQGINLAFADGHVKWFAKQDWPRPDSRAHFTFKQP